MAEFNFSVNGGDSIRLKTAGKYCDRDIVVTGSGGSGGKLVLHKLFETTAEMQAQPGIPMEEMNGGLGFTLYKFFDEVITAEEARECVGFTATTDALGYQKIYLSEIEDMGIAWGMTNRYGQAVMMCVLPEGAEAMGIETGIYFSENIFGNSTQKEVYIIGE